MAEAGNNVIPLQTRGGATLHARVENDAPLNPGGPGGTYGDMESRVTKLETHMEYVRRDLDRLATGQGRIEDVQGQILQKLNLLPTKPDLASWKLGWIGAGIAVFAVVTGSIIGGLAVLIDVIKP